MYEWKKYLIRKAKKEKILREAEEMKAKMAKNMKRNYTVGKKKKGVKKVKSKTNVNKDGKPFENAAPEIEKALPGIVH